MNETINDVLRKDYDSCVKSLKKSEKKREKIEKENQRLKNIIYTTLEYIDREEVSSVGTPFTSTSIGKEIKELLEGEKTFNSIWKENQRLNNVLNKIKTIIDDYYAYDYEDENLERLNVIDKINTVVLNELKESDK